MNIYLKDTWVGQTGEHPDRQGLNRTWFREAVLAGVPESVQQKLKENPDLIGADQGKWELNLIHHLQKKADEHKKESEETKKM